MPKPYEEPYAKAYLYDGLIHAAEISWVGRVGILCMAYTVPHLHALTKDNVTCLACIGGRKGSDEDYQ